MEPSMMNINIVRRRRYLRSAPPHRRPGVNLIFDRSDRATIHPLRDAARRVTPTSSRSEGEAAAPRRDRHD